jgi:hypothetical protein
MKALKVAADFVAIGAVILMFLVLVFVPWDHPSTGYLLGMGVCLLRVITLTGRSILEHIYDMNDED